MRAGQTIWVAVACLLVAGCGRSSTQSIPGVTPRNQIVPLLDAHQHMMSPAAMALTVRQPSPPTATVPVALAELLSAREKGVDRSNYAALFTPDALLYAEEQGRWWTGEARILDALGNF